MKNTINLNGSLYSGNSIVVSNGKIFIDGKDTTPDSKTIKITVVGDVDELKVDSCNTVKITGIVNSVNTQSGDVEIDGNVTGSIQTMSGDVECGEVGGSISTMSGNIKHKRY